MNLNMTYLEVKEKLIRELKLEKRYDVDDVYSVYENDSIIVNFVDTTPLIRMDYLKMFDRWSVCIYDSDYQFKDWYSVFLDIKSYQELKDNVTFANEDDILDFSVDDETLELMINEKRQEVIKELEAIELEKIADEQLEEISTRLDLLGFDSDEFYIRVEISHKDSEDVIWAQKSYDE